MCFCAKVVTARVSILSRLVFLTFKNQQFSIQRLVIWQRSIFVSASISVGEFKRIINYIYKIFNVRKNIRGSLLAFGLDSPSLLGTAPRLPVCCHVPSCLFNCPFIAVLLPLLYLPFHCNPPALYRLCMIVIAGVWDRTRAVRVGVQHATEWATRCPSEYIYIFDLHSQYSCALYIALSPILFYY
jgi:hypothetical protein